MPTYFQHKNPFDFLASLIAGLPQLDDELYRSQDKRNALVDTGDWDTKVHALLSACPEFNDIDILLKDGITQETLAVLCSWCKGNASFSSILSLVCALDETLYWDNILKASFLTVYLKDGFQALNDNWSETGIIMLPRVPSLNDPLDRAEMDFNPVKKNWAHTWDPGVNEELTNTYYVESSKLVANSKKYVAIHKVVTDWIVENPILIAVSPIAKGVQLSEPHCYESKGNCYFSVDGLSNPEYVRGRVKSAYQEAAKNGAAFLIFPEMLGDSSMLDSSQKASDFFGQIGEEMANAGYNSPMLILPPTWWQDKRNQLHIISGDGGYICVQEKQNPFLYHCDKTGKEHLEDLANTAPIVQVLHIPYIGRITFPICKDYLVVPYRELLARTLRSTLMLCPSYSKGKFSFNISAPAELEYGCYSLWVNTCSATPDRGVPPDHIGLISAPSSNPINYFKPQCGGQCGTIDDSCLFLVEINRTDKAPEITMRKHICPHAEPFKKEETS